MDLSLVAQLQAAQQETEPQFLALRGLTGALREAVKVAGETPVEALAIQKVAGKLRQAAAESTSETLNAAVVALDAVAREAMDGLAFSFSREVKDALSARGFTVDGRPPLLVVDPLVLHLDIAARRAQWFYGKEPLARPLSLSVAAILKALEQQRKAVVERNLDVAAFLGELRAAWQMVLDGRSRRPTGGRINIVEVYSQLIMNRQSARFWNAPSRATFRDYERSTFIRDLVLAREAPVPTVDGRPLRPRLGTATKSQAETAARSIWLPTGALDGEYCADISFDAD